MRTLCCMLVFLLLSHACVTRPAEREAQVPKSQPQPQPQPQTQSAEVQPVVPEVHFLDGLDVSKYQGEIDFVGVRNAGYHFVFIKASQGETYLDPCFQINYAAALAAGLKVGAYHYFQTNDLPKPQFDNYLRSGAVNSGDLAPVVDIESLTKHDLADWGDNLQTLLDLLEQQFGTKPIVYSGEHFAEDYLNRFGHYPLWLAEYGRDQPALPSGWNNWTFWQWSQSGVVSGINGNVDQNRFNGSIQDLNGLLVP